MRSWPFVSSALVILAACSLELGGTGRVVIPDGGGPAVIPDAAATSDAEPLPIDAPAEVSPPLTFVQVSVGPTRACGVTSVGGVKCWGNGVYGGNGDGTNNNRAAPVDVTGLVDAKTVAVGHHHTCATTTAGAVKCWGANPNGQLGDASTVFRSVPVATSGLATGVVSLVAGDSHTCALTDGGAVKCWGASSFGQVGDDSNTDRQAPVDVLGLTSGVLAIAAGESHTCALTTAGGVKCWGKNDKGQLGDNSTSNTKAPTDVDGLAAGVAAIGAGASHSCAVLATGAVKCWGLNTTGQLGDGSATDRRTPVDVADLVGQAVSVTAGAAHTCARTSIGGVSCWGNNSFRELADGTNVLRNKAVSSNVGAETSSIDAGGYVTCAVIPSTGKIRCWGRPDDGALGDGSAFLVTAATMPSLGSGATAISTGPRRACTIKVPSAVTCWGDYAPPADVAALSAAVSISVGSGYICYLVGSGIKCFGSNANGQLGDGTTVGKPSPTDVIGLTSGVASVSAGGNFTCARTTTSGAKCWGKNDVGQVGDNSKTERTTPVDVSGLTASVVAIETGNTVNTCAIVTGNTVKCWGSDQQTPLDIPSVIGATSLSVGAAHACAIVGGGAVKCWGVNANGQLGNMANTASAAAVSVFGLTGALAISAGDAQTCALMTGGGIKCWGANSGGQLGDGTTIDRNTPVDTLGVSGATAIGVGSTYACAIVAGGAISCWGRADACQLGSCTPTVPVDVAGP